MLGDWLKARLRRPLWFLWHLHISPELSQVFDLQAKRITDTYEACQEILFTDLQ
jgi:hypothetical protein